jgi:hypothetical protein
MPDSGKIKVAESAPNAGAATASMANKAKRRILSMQPPVSMRGKE